MGFLKNIWNKAKGVFGKVFNTVKKIVTGPVKKIFNVAKPIVDTFIPGAKPVTDAIAGGLNVAKGAINHIDDLKAGVVRVPKTVDDVKYIRDVYKGWYDRGKKYGVK